MRKQSVPRIDSIPPELCTREEAAAILGLKHKNSACSASKRYKHLLFTEVVHNGRRKLLYNRKQVEALVYPIEPSDYITVAEASVMLNYSVNRPRACAPFLKKHGIPRKWVWNHHAYYVYSRKAVEALRDERLANPRVRNKPNQ